MDEQKIRRRKEKAYEEKSEEHLAQACRSLGDFLNNLGRYEEACTEYEEASKLFNKLGKQLETAKSHRMVAEMYMLLSDFDQALKHVNRFIRIVKQLKNKIEIQRGYATLGRAYLLQGQTAADLPGAARSLQLAEKAFIQSLLVCKELSGQVSKMELLDMQARLYLNIGVVREHMEDFEESISYMEKAIKIAKANELHELLHQCYVSASLVYHHKKGDVPLALRFCNLALEVSERLPDRTKKECETLIIKAEIMIKEGDFQSAKQVLRKGYKLKSPEVNDRQNIEKMLRIVVVLCNTLDALVTTDSNSFAARKTLYEKMGDGCCLLQNYKKAIDFYLKMLECAEKCSESPKDLVSTYVCLYQTYKDDKQYEMALEYLWKEYEVNKDESVEAFNTLCNIGEIYEIQSKPFWTIQDCYRKAITEARKVKNTSLERIATTRLIRIQKKFNMITLMESLKDEANMRGIDVDDAEDESDSENVNFGETNTPDLADGVCLDELTDSDEEENPKHIKPTTARPQRKRNIGITVKRNNKGETQLHQACISGNLELARRLIEQGHTINIRDHAGWLPLHEACNHGHKEIAELLLDNGASAAINDKGGTGCDGITPLYDACSNGCLDVVELLLDRGANATLKTDFGDTVLNVLDKWRNTVDLNVFEQTQYERVRSKIAEQLNKAGMIREFDMLTPSSPASDRCESSTPCRDRNSLEQLRKLAYDSDSDNVDEGVSSIKRLSKSKDNLSDDDLNDTQPSQLLSTTPKAVSLGARPDGVLHPSNAKETYKSVMEHLKHPNRQLISSTYISSKKRSGYMDANDVADDWLVDDLKPDKKKRKLLTERHLYATDSTVRALSNTVSKENLRSPLKICEDDDSQNAFKVLLDSRGRPKQTSKLKLPKSLSLSESSSSKKQLSLLDNGFCRFRSESPQSSNENAEPEPDSTTSLPVVSIKSPQKLDVLVNPTVSFKIKVEDELLLIPIERKKLTETNIRWLAEEASRRYYNLVGLQPVLRLMTTDGFTFEENDLINVALDENMIAGKVLEWKISPLWQRYEEICNQLQIDVDADIKIVLEKSQSNCLQLNDYALMPDVILPIFRALLHQSNLRVLDLSNNFIQDEDCKQLVKSLGTLKQLKTLLLQGNCITSEGVEHLSKVQMTELEELSFSYNPLGNASVRALYKICSQTAKLKKLHLSSCQLSNFSENDLRFSDLTDFDVSFNNLTPSAFRVIMTKLNSCRIQNLNLNFSIACETQLGSKLLEFLEAGTCEKFRSLELSGCNLSDVDVFSISLHLTKAPDLELLNFSVNPKLSPAALHHVLSNVPHVRKLHMEHCWKNLDYVAWNDISLGSVERRPELIVLSANESNEEKLQYLWDMKHGSQAKIAVQENLFRMYSNDCDVI